MSKARIEGKHHCKYCGIVVLKGEKFCTKSCERMYKNEMSAQQQKNIKGRIT